MVGTTYSYLRINSEKYRCQLSASIFLGDMASAKYCAGPHVHTTGRIIPLPKSDVRALEYPTGEAKTRSIYQSLKVKRHDHVEDRLARGLRRILIQTQAYYSVRGPLLLYDSSMLLWGIPSFITIQPIRRLDSLPFHRPLSPGLIRLDLWPSNGACIFNRLREARQQYAVLLSL